MTQGFSAFRLILLAAILCGASACTHGISGRSRLAAVSEAAAPARQSATQSGRERLAAGMPGAAVGFFQVALATGEPPAAAFNGLGVGYARLGRQDLAVRYFRMAAQIDPANPAFAANLRIASEAFAAREMLAAQRAGDAARQRVHALTTVPQVQPGRIERTSQREVRIVTLPPRPAPIARMPVVRVAVAAPIPVPAPVAEVGATPAVPDAAAAASKPSLVRVVTGIRIASTAQPLALTRIAP